MKKYFLFLIIILLVSCKKERNNVLNSFDTAFHIQDDQVGKFGLLRDSSDYEVKLIGAKSLFTPNKDFGSYSFGDILKIDASKLLCVANRYSSGVDDHAYSEFASRTSDDRGKTWSEEQLFKANLGGGLNILAPNLLRIDAKTVIFMYAHKLSTTAIDIYIQTSIDNAKTFGEARKINTVEGYQAFNNARLIQLKSGRIILPVSINDRGTYRVFCYFSDDLGATWNESALLSANFSLMEPGVVELPSGEILMVIRTQEGSLFFSKSTDKGKSWRNLYRSELISPESPATILTYKDKLVIFWNETNYIPNNYRNRTPLNIALSADNGNTWNMVGKIETNLTYQYSYLSAVNDGNDMLLTYYKRHRQSDNSELVFSTITLVEKNKP